MTTNFKYPAARRFDWPHILDRHSAQGRIARQRTSGTIFAGLTDEQIKARIRAAWRQRKLISTQTDPLGVERQRYQGMDSKSGQTLEFWYNRKTKVVETSYPLG